MYSFALVEVIAPFKMTIRPDHQELKPKGFRFVAYGIHSGCDTVLYSSEGLYGRKSMTVAKDSVKIIRPIETGELLIDYRNDDNVVAFSHQLGRWSFMDTNGFTYTNRNFRLLVDLTSNLGDYSSVDHEGKSWRDRPPLF